MLAVQEIYILTTLNLIIVVDHKSTTRGPLQGMRGWRGLVHGALKVLDAHSIEVAGCMRYADSTYLQVISN